MLTLQGGLRCRPRSRISCALLAGLLALAAHADDPPSVTLTSPNGGQVYAAESAQTITWIATDDENFIIGVDVFVSYDGGANYDALALLAPLNGSLDWFVPNRPTTQAIVRVRVYDLIGQTDEDVSDNYFTITAKAGGRLGTTLRDFDMPGSLPLDVEPLTPSNDCANCHGGYDPTAEPSFNFRGSMHSYASVDPLFLATLDVANADATSSGDLCIRCHTAKGWLAGRSTPTDYSAILPGDKIGVGCDVCHRLVDPIYEAGVSPAADVDILAALRDVPDTFSSGQYVIDPAAFRRRGPFTDTVAPHTVIVSPFHREAALCGTCHDVSNPAFTRNPDGSYSPNALDTPAPAFGSHQLGAVERTYSEWLFSAFNSPGGVYAPEFGGSRQYVSTCQHCHMRAVTGRGCFYPEAVLRNDMPLHDFTGGNTWMLSIIDQVDPNAPVDERAASISRARYMLQNASELKLSRDGNMLAVKVTNRTGHKLPTGYPEGRRMWINVKFFDASDTLVKESGVYDSVTGELHNDAEIKIYEAVPVIAADVAPLVGLAENTPFHFVLNSKWLKDNRIPPLGFTNAEYDWFGGAPVGATYADGQNWDRTLYKIPGNARRAVVTLYYQTTSKEYVEFLRDEGIPGGAGQEMYDLWAANGKCPPEQMEQRTLLLPARASGGTPDQGTAGGSADVVGAKEASAGIGP